MQLDNRDQLIAQFVQRMEELSEYTKELKLAIDRLDDRIKLFSQRLDEAEKNIATLAAKQYSCCPVHDQVVNSFIEKINDIEVRTEKLREEFRDEIKFRDRLLYGILGSVIAQIIATISITLIKVK